MDEHGGGGLELAWILWTCVAALFLVFGVAELVRPQHTVSFWLVAGLICTSCSILALVPGLRGGGADDTLGPAMAGGGPGDGEEAPFPASDETRGVVVDAALALVETQLLAQAADDASVDGRATGLIGFNGALLAAGIAVKELVALGPLWPSPFVVVVGTTFFLLWGLYGGRRGEDQQEGEGDQDERGAQGARLHPAPQPNRAGVSVGVRADRFYEKHAERSPLDARERLLDDLVLSFDKNFLRITRKRQWLQRATLFLIVGLAVAALMILLDRPTSMKAWEKKPTPHLKAFVSCPALLASNRSARAASLPTPGCAASLASGRASGD
jgi:hypothetical protein